MLAVTRKQGCSLAPFDINEGVSAAVGALPHLEKPMSSISVSSASGTSAATYGVG